MEEIPSCVVDRLSQEYGFVVLSRPNALQQMLDKCTIPGEHSFAIFPLPLLSIHPPLTAR